MSKQREIHFGKAAVIICIWFVLGIIVGNLVDAYYGLYIFTGLFGATILYLLWIVVMAAYDKFKK